MEKRNDDLDDLDDLDLDDMMKVASQTIDRMVYFRLNSVLIIKFCFVGASKLELLIDGPK